MNGILYGIGVGPGDPELLTLKAVRCMRESDVLLLPAEKKEDCYAYQIAALACPDIEKKEALAFSFPMTKDAEKLKQAHDAIAQKVLAYLRTGKKMAFLTIGDPTVYSTYRYIQTRIQEQNGKTETISGVPSFCAVAASLGISLADRSQEIHIIPATYKVQEALQLKGTRIFMKSGKKLGELQQLLWQQSEQENIEVYAVSDCGLPTEKKCYGIASLKELESYLTIVIVKEKE
ncbi:MAG: precorrin-2 C(20)-methyltransferase [Lachnospiraceae bacterium]